MSFRCQFCGGLARPGTTRQLVTTKTKIVRRWDDRLGEFVETTQIAEQKAMCQPCWLKGES